MRAKNKILRETFVSFVIEFYFCNREAATTNVALSPNSAASKDSGEIFTDVADATITA